MDKIKIEGLEIFANHGVLKEENVLGQKFIVDAELYCDTRAAGKKDDLNRSVNYAHVGRLIESEMQNNTFKLIEAAAEKIAERILLEYGAVNAVTVRVKKPWAPIMMRVDTVEVEITRKRHRAYIALGSNIGDTYSHLNAAVEAIGADKYCEVKKVSEFIVTKPVGEVEQDDFLNGCIEIETLYTPHELLDFLHAVENSRGRKRKVHWGPRTLDLDIIFYDDAVIADEDLIIPHIETEKREFVLAPLSMIAPYARHPISGRTAAQMLADIRR